MIKLHNLIRGLKLWKIQLHNLILFLIGCARYSVPPWKWRRAWRAIQVEHLAETGEAFGN